MEFTAPVPAVEVVKAVKDMLSAVGMPIGLEQLSLMERSMTLQEQLSAAETALSAEQVGVFRVCWSTMCG